MSKKLIVGAAVMVVVAGAAYIILKNNSASTTGNATSAVARSAPTAVAATVRAPNSATGETAPVPASVPAASTGPTYFLHGNWVENLPVRAQRTNPTDGSTIYMVEEHGFTKMVDSKGNARYYTGTIADFDVSKWNSYNKADGNYLLKQCPAGATVMC